MKGKHSVFWILGLMLAVCCTASADGAQEKAAIQEATRWLKIVDTGDYAKAWRQADPLIQKAVDEKTFVKQLQAARGPMGKLVSRTLKGASSHTSLPGAPDGQYVVIQFDTRLENKKNAVETITPKLGTDGKWRVSGYYIK